MTQGEIGTIRDIITTSVNKAWENFTKDNLEITRQYLLSAQAGIETLIAEAKLEEASRL